MKKVNNKNLGVFLVIFLGFCIVYGNGVSVKAQGGDEARGNVHIGNIEDRLGEVTGFSFAGGKLGTVIHDAVPYIFMLAGAGVLFYLIFGGYQLMISAGNEQAMAEAKGKITNALIGFVIIFVSYWIVQIMSTIFGLGGFGGIF